jgi:hypothetical protein
MSNWSEAVNAVRYIVKGNSITHIYVINDENFDILLIIINNTYKVILRSFNLYINDVIL